VRLDPNDFGRIDRAYNEVIVEGNMHIKFAILSAYTSQQVPITREVEVTRLAQVAREVR
jgi:hypothetical protein